VVISDGLIHGTGIMVADGILTGDDTAGMAPK
jgi:hypothetical protein